MNCMAEELYHLIIVDDDEYVRWSLSKYCDWEQLGFRVEATLEDGSDAVAYMQKHPVDAILTDVRMFQMSGLELAAWVHDQYPETCVVILSGYEEFDYVRSAIQYEAVDYLIKPVEKKALVSAFSKVKDRLDRQKSRRHALDFFLNPAIERAEAILAEAVVKDRVEQLDGLYWEWLQTWDGAGGMASSVIIARLFRSVYHRLEENGVMLSDEWSSKHVYAQIAGMNDKPNMAVVKNLLMRISEQRHDLITQNNLVSRVKAWVDAHLSENISLDDISSALYVSKGHLCRQFRSDTGESLMGYLERKRMEKAEELLFHSDRKFSNAQVAAMVGYRDSRYFKKVFSKYRKAKEGANDDSQANT